VANPQRARKSDIETTSTPQNERWGGAEAERDLQKLKLVLTLSAEESYQLFPDDEMSMLWHFEGAVVMRTREAALETAKNTGMDAWVVLKNYVAQIVSEDPTFVVELEDNPKVFAFDFRLGRAFIGDTIDDVKSIIAKYSDTTNFEYNISLCMPLKTEDKNRNAIIESAFNALAALPTGEVQRLLQTIEKRREKWSGAIPIEAPELYRDRQAKEDLPTFLRRVYGARGLLDGSLTKAHLDILDPSLADGVRAWISHHGSLPDDIDLPSKFERTPEVKSRRGRKQRREP